jgi:adenylylsulfate kinase
MTSAGDSGRAVAAAAIVWITGLSGTGKTTLARAVIDALNEQGEQALLLDGDVVRTTLETHDEALLHDRNRRLRRAHRIASLARMTATQGIPVIVATVSLFREVQQWNRAGPGPFGEVLLTADLDVLRQRNPKLYGARGRRGEPDVVGIDITPEFPVNPEVVIAQSFEHFSLPNHVMEVVALYRRLSRPSPGR